MSSIILNARFTSQPLTGVQRVCYELGRRLVNGRTDVIAVAPSAATPDYDLPVMIRALPIEVPGHVWEQTVLRRASWKSDLVVNLNGTGPLGPRNQIVMIHDVNYLLGPEGYTRSFRTGYRLLQRALAERTTICTVSHWSAGEIARAFGLAKESITIIPNAADHIGAILPDRATLPRHGLGKRPFALCVGSANPNKNFISVLQAYAAIECPTFDLAIVGSTDLGIFGKETGFADVPGFHRVGRVSDAELRELMERAAVFVMPSHLEGFGLPALEAMLLGTPVIAANASALPEVCGDAALYFAPTDTRTISELMRTIISDRDLARSLGAKGKMQAARYSWDRSADQLRALCTEKCRSFVTSARYR